MNSMLEYTEKIQRQWKTVQNYDKQIENLKSSNTELESKNEELSAIAREAIDWAQMPRSESDARNLEAAESRSQFGTPPGQNPEGWDEPLQCPYIINIK